uniref:Uncharacterized protein n=1 Tax=Arundo donax TaxID=35708 RepID=A0A0A8ZK66_ARUDO
MIPGKTYNCGIQQASILYCCIFKIFLP